MLWYRMKIVHVNEDCDIAKNKATYDAKKYREKRGYIKGLVKLVDEAPVYIICTILGSTDP